MSPHTEASPAEAARLQRCLAAELALVSDLVAALEHERNILTSGNPGEYPPLLERKDTLCRRLSNATGIRLRTQVELGLPAASLPDLVDSFAARFGNGLADAWSQLISCSRAAANLNRANGRLLAERQAANQHSLAVLTSAAGEPSTYTPRGLAMAGLGFTGNRGRSFGVA